jgi:hypothetical protein
MVYGGKGWISFGQRADLGADGGSLFTGQCKGILVFHRTFFRTASHGSVFAERN